MRLIKKQPLKMFAEGHGPAAVAAMRGWWTAVEYATWTNWADVKQTFGSADAVGNCVVFDVGGNKYRVIARISYRRKSVYILKVMTHSEYDQRRHRARGGHPDWYHECGCGQPPPKRPKT